MGLKISGAEFKAFMNDDKFWISDPFAKANPQSGLTYTWYEDSVIQIDGVDFDGAEFNGDPEKIDDAAVVVIECGIVWNPWGKKSEDWTELKSCIKSWKKKQTTVRAAIEFDSRKVDKTAVEAALKALGVKVAF